MDAADNLPASPEATANLDALNRAVEDALERKRRLGQYWIEWDGEKPVKVYPDGRREAAE